MILPRIAGVRHVSNHLQHAKALIDALQEESLIGLEAMYPMAFHPSFSRKYPHTARYLQQVKLYFEELAEYAQSKGHAVKWLDRPLFSLAKNHAVFKRVEAELASFPNSLRVPGLLAQTEPTENLTDTLRTYIYAHEIKKLQSPANPRPWKPTDVVFVGASHAAQLGHILQRPVEYLGFSPKQVEEIEDEARQLVQEYQQQKVKRQADRKISPTLHLRRTLSDQTKL